MFRIKICGITNVDDAMVAAEAGADAIGLNFFPKSPRFLAADQAGVIAREVKAKYPSVAIVGVFVNSSAAEVLEISSNADLTAVQLHGDETPADVCKLRSQLPPRVKIIRAFRCRDSNLHAVRDYLEACQSVDTKVIDTILLDAYQPGAYGGTGAVVDWPTVRQERHLLGKLPVLLAGGLTPLNVAEAIRQSAADGVDVASGVESSPRAKNPALIRQFINAANSAFPTTGR